MVRYRNVRDNFNAFLSYFPHAAGYAGATLQAARRLRAACSAL